jgi:hypothetical protein
MNKFTFEEQPNTFHSPRVGIEKFTDNSVCPWAPNGKVTKCNKDKCDTPRPGVNKFTDNSICPGAPKKRRNTFDFKPMK